MSGRIMGETWIKRDPETDAAAKRFGKAVRRARMQLDLTQRELANIVHTTQPTIRQIEVDGVTPASRYFFPLVDELGLDPLSFGFVREGRVLIMDRLIMERMGGDNDDQT